MNLAGLNQNRAQLYILFSVIMYRINECLIKQIASNLGTFEILFFRSIFTIVLIASFCYSLKLNLKFSIEKYTLIRNILAGISIFFEVASLEYITLTSLILLLSSAPIFIKILAYFFLKEPISIIDICVISISTIGILFVLDCSLKNEPVIGVVYALIGSFMYSISCIFTKKIEEPNSTEIYLIYVVVLFLISLLKLPSFVPSMNELIILFFMAIIHIMAFLLYLKGFFILTTSRGAVLEYSGIVVAMFLDYLFWDKIPYEPQLFGGLLIFTASLLSIYREKLRLLIRLKCL